MTSLTTKDAAGRSEPAARPASPSRARVGVPFVLVHLGVLALPFVGWSWAALGGCAVLYVSRMLGITVFYHRGFAHRSFAMTRPVQLAGAVLGAAAGQRGPLWWVATHRVHHRFTDRPGDPHSPVVDGFLQSHVGWLFRPQSAPPGNVADLARFPELRLVDRFHHIAPIATALAAFGFSASPHVTAAVATIAQGLAAIVTAFMVRPVRIPVITGGLTTAAVGLGTFGLHITSSEITVVMTVVAAVLGLFMPIRTTSVVAGRKQAAP